MKESIWQKRIPTLLGIMLIAIGVVATSSLVKQGTSFLGFASPSNTPQDIRLTNISDTSATLTYITEAKTTGSVFFGTTDALGTSILDEEGQVTKNIVARNTHLISFKNLAPSTTYYFTITSGDTTFLNNGTPFTFTTTPTITGPPSDKFEMNGKVIFQDAANEALVYVEGDKLQPLAVRIGTDGIYKISYENIRGPDLNSFSNLNGNDILHMLIIGNGAKSNVTLFANQIRSIPTIILSKNYDFTISSTPVATVSASLGFPILVASPSSSQAPEIVTPKKDASFVDMQPLFKGTATPGEKVEIEIHSDEQLKTVVTADRQGNWTFRPTTPLSPGTHTIKITTRDAFGIIKTITQSFTVYAAGSQVNQTATPSATLTPTLVESAPTQSSNPTATPIPLLSLTPTETAVVIPTNFPTLPPEGTVEAPGSSSIIFGISGLFITAAGIFLLLLSRGGAL